MDAEQIQLAEMIDKWVNDIAGSSVSGEQVDGRILESAVNYMIPFKQLLDSCTSLEMQVLINKYDGLYRFANLLERLAEAIQDGAIDVPQNVPLPAEWGQPPKKKKGNPRKKNLKHPLGKKKQQQIRRDISFLPTYTEIIIGELAQTEEQWGVGNKRTIWGNMLNTR